VQDVSTNQKPFHLRNALGLVLVVIWDKVWWEVSADADGMITGAS